MKHLEEQKKKRKWSKQVTVFDNFDLAVTWQIVNNLYLVEKYLLTAAKLHKKKQNDLNFIGLKTSVRRILKQLE